MAESSNGTPTLYKGLPERRERPAAKGGLDKLYLRAGRHGDRYRAVGLFAAQGGGEYEDAVSWLTNRADRTAHRTPVAPVFRSRPYPSPTGTYRTCRASRWKT